MKKEHFRLCDKVENGEFNGETFARKANDLFDKYFKLIGQVIGPEDYQTIFGQSIDTPLVIINPNIARNFYYTNKS